MQELITMVTCRGGTKGYCEAWRTGEGWMPSEEAELSPSCESGAGTALAAA
jgi:hypothetical protein